MLARVCIRLCHDRARQPHSSESSAPASFHPRARGGEGLGALVFRKPVMSLASACSPNLACACCARWLEKAAGSVHSKPHAPHQYASTSGDSLPASVPAAPSVGAAAPRGAVGAGAGPRPVPFWGTQLLACTKTGCEEMPCTLGVAWRIVKGT
eukprot:3289349-Rhodomonas_salina.1